MNLTDVFLMSKRSLMERLFECVSSYDIFCSIGRCKSREVILSPIRNNHLLSFYSFEDKDESILKTLPGKEVTYLSL
jgi:hypothetical protein